MIVVKTDLEKLPESCEGCKYNTLNTNTMSYTCKFTGKIFTKSLRLLFQSYSRPDYCPLIQIEGD